ncbi:MAG: hypothetical protein AAF716_08245 [Cyanobacteria bacterium P01_D01_bin.1]
MFRASGFKPSNSSPKVKNLDLLVRTAIAHKELSPGVAAQVNQYRNGKLSCKERRMIAVLDDAIASGHITAVEMPISAAVLRKAVCRVG